MMRSVHIPRSAAWLLLLPILLSAGTVRGDTADLASYCPQQGTLFDGAYTARRSWYVDFGESGFQVEHHVPVFLCPGSPRDTLDSVLRFAPERRVFQIPAVVAAYDQFRYLVRLELPPALAALTDDCGILDEFEAVQAFLQVVTDRSALLLSQIDACLASLRDAYCDARTAILDAPIVSSEEEGFFPPLPGGGGGGSSGSPVPPPCSQYRYVLNELVARVDAMSVKRLMCTSLLDVMEGAPAYVLQRIAMAGGLTAQERTLALAGIDTWLAAAEDAQQAAATLKSEIAASVASYTLEAVALSCDQCPQEGATGASLQALLVPPTAGDESEAVVVRRGREPLDRYVRSLWRAVRNAGDRREALRLASLALRLSWMPSCRVLHVTYRGSAGIGQEYVALRSPCRREAWGAPWVVVLTVLPADAPLPDPTPRDHDRLLDAIDAFNTLLPPADEDAHASEPTVPRWAARPRWPGHARSRLPVRRRR